MDQDRLAARSKSMRISNAIAALALIMTLLVPSGTSAAAPVVTVKSILFSGTLKTDLEDISVAGTLHLRSEVTLTATTVFARVDSNISQTTGIGLKSGQAFVGVSVPLQMCKIPAGPRGSLPVSVDINSQFRLIPTGPPSPFYVRGAPQQPLLLIIHASFLSDGSLLGASSLLGNVPPQVP